MLRPELADLFYLKLGPGLASRAHHAEQIEQGDEENDQYGYSLSQSGASFDLSELAFE